MNRVEGMLYTDDRVAGVVHAATGIGLALLAGTVLRSTAAATYVTAAPRGLARAAQEVETALSSGDLDRAKELLPGLVGRDPTALDESGVARAVVESVAENTVDAVVAPACWSLVGGAPGTLVYRAVNTLDAMVGHRSERYRNYGWASARLDDAANYVPARVTALLVAAVRPDAAARIWRAVRVDAPQHPSPNAGVAEASFAAALDVKLGGVNRYGDRSERRAALGTGRPPERTDIGRAVALSTDVTLALSALMAAWSMLP